MASLDGGSAAATMSPAHRRGVPSRSVTIRDAADIAARHEMGGTDCGGPKGH